MTVVEEAGVSRRAGIFEEWALEGIFEEQVLKDREPPQGWAREPETEGWTEPAGTTERGEGPVQSPDQSLSLSDPPPCPAVPAVYSAHPQMQGAELISMLSLSAAFSHVAGSVAGSRTLIDVIIGSGAAAILSTVTPCGDGSSVTAGSDSPSAVGSGMRSAQRGDGGLCTGSGVDLARSFSGQTVRGDPFLTRVHSMKAAKSSRGPSSDDSALHAVFRLAS